MRREASAIELGGLRIRVEWRDMGFDSGIAIRVDVATGEGQSRPIAKFDAFRQNPHWHLFHRDGTERIHHIESGDSLECCLELLGQLSDILHQAGYRDAAPTWADDEIVLRLIPKVLAAIQSVEP